MTESYLQRSAEALRNEDVEAFNAVIHAGIEHFSKPIEELVLAAHPADYPLIVALLESIADSTKATLSPAGAVMAAALRQRIQTEAVSGYMKGDAL